MFYLKPQFMLFLSEQSTGQWLISACFYLSKSLPRVFYYKSLTQFNQYEFQKFSSEYKTY